MSNNAMTRRIALVTTFTTLTMLSAAPTLLVGCDKPETSSSPDANPTADPDADPDTAASPAANPETDANPDTDADPSASPEVSDPEEDPADDGAQGDGDEEGDEGDGGDENGGNGDEDGSQPSKSSQSSQSSKSSGKKPAAEKFALPRAVHRSVDDSCGKGPGVGSTVKSFKLQTPGGKNISPGMFRGRVVLLNFWGTWCKPCLEELPEFDRLYQRYRKYGMSLVAVATDEDGAEVKAFLDKKKIAAKVAVGGEATASAYGARQFPFTFVVDAKGVIRGSYSGYKPECMGKLEQDLRDELEKINE